MYERNPISAPGIVDFMASRKAASENKINYGSSE